MTCRLGTGSNCTGGDAITWTSFNKPVQINKGNNHDIFSYGPDQSRFKRVSKLGANTTTIRYGKRGSLSRTPGGRDRVVSTAVAEPMEYADRWSTRRRR